MTERPVISTEPLDGPVSDWELNVALDYARNPKGKYRRELDRDLLRLVVNTAIERRRPESILPFLTAEVAREVIPQREKKDALKYEAYKGAAMKVFSGRSARARSARAQKKKAARPRSHPPPSEKPGVYPEDQRPKHKGQLKML